MSASANALSKLPNKRIATAVSFGSVVEISAVRARSSHARKRSITRCLVHRSRSIGSKPAVFIASAHEPNHGPPLETATCLPAKCDTTAWPAACLCLHRGDNGPPVSTGFAARFSVPQHRRLSSRIRNGVWRIETAPDWIHRVGEGGLHFCDIDLIESITSLAGSQLFRRNRMAGGGTSGRPCAEQSFRCRVECGVLTCGGSQRVTVVVPLADRGDRLCLCSSPNEVAGLSGMEHQPLCRLAACCRTRVSRHSPTIAEPVDCGRVFGEVAR